MEELKKKDEKTPLKSSKSPGRYFASFVKKNWTTILIIMILVMGAMTTLLIKGVIGVGASALSESYRDAYNAEREAAYQDQYDKYFERAEQKYHVSNRVAITIGDLRETAALEVLEVSDVEYIVEESNDNSDGITSWLEVPGHGTYVVDLQAAEFVVDDRRAHVLVKAPFPELTNIAIDYANVQKLLFKNDLLDDSDKVGEDLARRQLNAADMLIKKEFASNQHFYLSAESSAISTIQCLVKQLNPNVQNLIVDVEFYK